MFKSFATRTAQSLLNFRSTTARKQPQTKKARELKMERLENRDVMAASVTLSGGVLAINGDSWNNSAVVNLRNNQVEVRVSSTPANGFSLVPEIVTKSFSSSSVKSITFHGNAGDDSFVSNYSIPSKAWGGSGNDYLEGANAVDVFYGGSGNDTLKGYGGNDQLYGDSGNDALHGMDGNDDMYGGNDADKLYGGNGNDGLYGGAGSDSLYGNSGSDRFLVMSGQTEHKDAVSTDAVIVFKNGTKTWNADEVEAIDSGLKLLHRETGNDNLLETKSGGTLTFVRGGSKGSTLATNHGNGTITYYDGTFSSDDMAALTAIHEMAHNWENEHSGWSKWLGLSGWQTARPSASQASQFTKSLDGDWYYRSSASFARNYGTNNPYDDFATAWEAYFRQQYKIGTNPLNNNSLSSAKFKHLDSFFASIS